MVTSEEDPAQLSFQHVKRNYSLEPSMGTYTSNVSTQESEAGDFLRRRPPCFTDLYPGQPSLSSAGNIQTEGQHTCN